MSEKTSAIFDSADAAVLVCPKPRRRKKERPQKEPLFNVILWNDDVHTYEYVIVMLNTVFGYSFSKGFNLAQEVDRSGRAVVFTSTLQEAETKRDQILAFGPDPLINGSDGPIIATLEKMPGE